MSVLGGISESERQHVQARVRAAMDAQVVNEGRHQGGRAPYGYVTVNVGPHPNPRKAAEGACLRVLQIEESSAAVVRRIFQAYVDGNGDRAIATMLNEEGVPCPSARRPDQNRHRQADGWQGSTVRAIIDNPRYTGYAVFGRWARREMLLDPDDVAAGHVIRFRRAAPNRIERSLSPRIRQSSRSSCSLRHSCSAGPRTPGAWRLRGRPSAASGGSARTSCAAWPGAGCATGGWRGEMVRKHAFYRCASRTMTPGSAALADHLATVNLREDVLVPALNGWIGGFFPPENVDDTVAALVGAQASGGRSGDVEAAKARRADADQRLRRFQSAIAAGVDPVAMVDAINQAQAERTAAQAEIDNAPTGAAGLDAAEDYAMIDSLGDVGAVIGEAKPASLQRLYQALNVQVRYEPDEKAAYVTAEPRVDSACVRGGTCTLATRLAVG